MITPLDIRKMEFNRKMRGYDADEVRAALDSIAMELEDQIKESTRLNERLKIAEERINHFKLMEKTLQDSVLTMQTTLDEKKKGAEQEANLIIQEAKSRASGELVDYTEKIKKLRTEIESLENQKTNYFIRFKNFLHSQMDWLDAMEKGDGFFKDLEKNEGEFRNAAAGASRLRKGKREVSDIADMGG
ncbi:DivIVA domain-containing protein [Fibrobacterota bacterium]